MLCSGTAHAIGLGAGRSRGETHNKHGIYRPPDFPAHGEDWCRSRAVAGFDECSGCERKPTA